MDWINHLNILNFFIYINLFLVLSVIFFERKSATATWAWIMIMLFIPIIGFILYLFIGQDLRKRKTFNRKEEEDSFLALLHHQQLSLDHELTHYTNLLVLPYKDLIALHLNAHEALYTEDNTLELFTDGHDLFNTLLLELKQAKKCIHIEYYMFRDDKLGQAIKDILIKHSKIYSDLTPIFTKTPVYHPGFTGMQIVSSGPDSKYDAVYNGFVKMIHMAKQSIWIQTPYFIPDDGLTTALKLAALSGKDVRIMIPNKPDHIFVYWATYYHIGQLLESGVRCFTYENGFLHAKTIMIDDEICSIGTANFDIRSFRLNFEINAFIYDVTFSRQLSQSFINDLTYCNELTLALYQKRGLLIKFKESLSRLISPIL